MNAASIGFILDDEFVTKTCSTFDCENIAPLQSVSHNVKLQRTVMALTRRLERDECIFLVNFTSNFNQLTARIFCQG